MKNFSHIIPHFKTHPGQHRVQVITEFLLYPKTTGAQDQGCGQILPWGWGFTGFLLHSPAKRVKMGFVHQQENILTSAISNPHRDLPASAGGAAPGVSAAPLKLFLQECLQSPGNLREHKTSFHNVNNECSVQPEPAPKINGSLGGTNRPLDNPNNPHCTGANTRRGFSCSEDEVQRKSSAVMNICK